MTVSKITYLVVTFLILTFMPATAQEIKGLDKSPLDFAIFRPDGQNATPIARIIYSRPSKKDRNIFGELVKYGKVWRTGANQSTEINIYRAIEVEGKTLEAGNYTLYTIPDKDKWTIIFNSKLYTWGAFDYDSSKDVLRVEVPVKHSSVVREHFGIAFDGKKGRGTMLMAWDDIEVFVNFEY